jgi:ERF superfamily
MNDHSEQLNELGAALSKAQGEFGSVPKNSNNPFFKSSYADLATVVQTAAPIITKQGLSVSQFPGYDGEGDTLTTLLLHSSGQYIAQTMRLHLTKTDAQGQGSAMTYARRYSYMAVLGLVADIDDDGNAASKPRDSAVKLATALVVEKNRVAEKPVQPPTPPQAWLIHPGLMAELRSKLKAADITGDAASSFVQATIGHPAPKNNAEAQLVIDALHELSTGEPFA